MRRAEDPPTRDMATEAWSRAQPIPGPPISSWPSPWCPIPVAWCRWSARPPAWTCPVGARLRLDIAGARFPAFDRNPHDGSIAGAGVARNAYRVATIEGLAARLELPVETGARSEE